MPPGFCKLSVRLPEDPHGSSPVGRTHVKSTTSAGATLCDHYCLCTALRLCVCPVLGQLPTETATRPVRRSHTRTHVRAHVGLQALTAPLARSDEGAHVLDERIVRLPHPVFHEPRPRGRRPSLHTVKQLEAMKLLQTPKVTKGIQTFSGVVPVGCDVTTLLRCRRYTFCGAT